MSPAKHELHARLEEFRFADPDRPGPRRVVMRQAGVVVVHFDGADLDLDVAYPDTDDADLLDFLARDCQRTLGIDGLPHWTLVDAQRRATAADLGEDGLLDEVYFGRLPRPEHPVQTAIAQWLGPERLPSVDELDVDRCRALLQVVHWFGHVLPQLPPAEVVEARIARDELMRPLRELVGDFFRGRTELLARLGGFVDDPAPSRPLVLWGPGGVGKSTVVARFLLDRTPGPTGVAFGYLNFDRAVLDPLLPRSVLVEATRQLGLQFPGRGAERVMSVLLDEDFLESADSYEAALSTRVRTDRDDGALQAFAELLVDLTGAAGRFVLVLDTFEEVQRRGASAAWTVLDYLDRVRPLAPSLRVIVVGRSQVARTDVEHHQVEDLDPDAATAYLLARVPDLKDDELTRVLDEVGRNPLSLRLAAQLLLDPTVDRTTALLSLHQGAVQGVLYQRVLDHIEDPQVRAVAHPGLVLRRITAEIIEQVLARPCRLRLITPDAADDLFRALENEATLVERRPEDPEALWYRGDVRALVLTRVIDDARDRAATIHRGAVRYYRGRPGAVARAEEMYHRMMLGQSPRTLRKYWSDDAAPMLYRSFDELPASAQVFLAPRLGGEVADRLDAVVLADADAADRAMHLRNRVTPMLTAGLFGDALREVANARLPDGGPLVPELEVEVRERVGDLDGALEVARDHVQLLRRGRGDHAYIAAVLTLARLLEKSGRIAEATAQVEGLRPLVQVLGDDMETLRVDVALLRLTRAAGGEPSEVASETVDLAEDVGSYALARDPALLRSLGAEVGDRSDAILAAALRHVGVDLSAPGDVPEQLADALTTFDAAVSDRYGDAPGKVFRGLERLPDQPVARTELTARIRDAGTRSVSRSIAKSIDSYGSTPDLTDTLVKMYRDRDRDAL